MSATEQMPPKTLPCVTIGRDDARKLRAKVQGMKRAALNIEWNARQFANEADKFTELLDLIIEPE